jgi:murein DD-endopeptidase MepM/ murein hydrolase activator NlpD
MNKFYLKDSHGDAIQFFEHFLTRSNEYGGNIKLFRDDLKAGTITETFTQFQDKIDILREQKITEAKNKGIDIAGKLGDSVMAAADGRVVYAGAGLRGYGNLIILKHSNTYLTAYAHNQALLVKEEQTVKQGQKIAEMGNSDADRIKLHFELRRQGKPVDPLKFLPAR